MKTALRFRQASVLVLAGLAFLLTANWSRAQSGVAAINLIKPANGASYFAPADIQIAATTVDSFDGVVVTIYAGTNVLDVSSSPPGFHGGIILTKVVSFDWTNVPAGSYPIYAKAVHGISNGVTSWSKTNVVTVISPHYLAVTIVQPSNNVVYPGPTNINLLAGGLDTNGSVAFVEFFDDGESLGFVTNGVVLDPLPPPNEFPPGWQTGDLAYPFDWTNQSIGTHTLIAEITDTNGQTAVSPPLAVVIGSNIPPTVRFVSPPNDIILFAPMNIPLVAFANSPDGQIASVQFFAGTNSLGFGAPFQAPIVSPPEGGQPIPIWPRPTNLFLLTWTNPAPGSYDLFAVATDGSGSSSTSAPISISVFPSVIPPPTNLPNLVGVVATDPIAIAGTNCWIWRGLTNSAGSWTQWVSPVAIWQSFTNCGPKDAAFTVHRFGDNGSNLVVSYTLTGSATNGIDYVALPGSVVIPAGENAAVISLLPIENGSNYVRTVFLTLDASTNTPADYLLGFDHRAAALIEDRPLLAFPEATVLGGGAFHFGMSGPDGAWFHIDFSTNLIEWTPLCTNQVIDGSIDFVDPGAVGSSSRLYRTVPMSGPPSN